MGKEIADNTAGTSAAGNTEQIDFNKYITGERPAGSASSGAVVRNAVADGLAPSSVTDRMWDVTKEGVHHLGDGFMNSLDYRNIVPNVGAGIIIGAATKALLAEGGPVAKVAGGLMTAYFLGRPMVETYGAAINAKTQTDMHDASVMWGNAIGGLPVSMAEGAVGAKLGAFGAGKLLATDTAAPFTDWKARQYAKLDGQVDTGLTAVRNTAFETFGIGRPVIRSGSFSGIIPPHMLEELATRNPDNPAFMDTIKKTNAIRMDRPLFDTRVVGKVEANGAREVYDAKGQESDGIKVRSEGEPKTGNKEVDNVFDYTGDVRGYYKDVHNRNSIDGKGMTLMSTVNYGDNFENAFWNSVRMTYGKPGAQSPFTTFVLRDVTGHEMTHGVTEFESGLVYRAQPGALNEHLSDVFGALVEQKAKGQTADKATWLIGDGIWKPEIKGRALRDMMKPGTAYDDAAIGKDPQPAHMDNYVNTRRDNGGVHLNSGIPNRAFALFATDVGGNAWEGPGKIWYQARANAGSEPSFNQFAYHTIEAAKQLGYTSEVPKLEKAWADVGVKPSATDKGIQMPADVPVVTENDITKGTSGGVR